MSVIQFTSALLQKQFDKGYEECTELIERTAAYLDGIGRSRKRLLLSSEAELYSAESLRLTTRLMLLASWFMARREILDGKVEVAARFGELRKKVKDTDTRSTKIAGLPEDFKELLRESFAMRTRVIWLDEAIRLEEEQASKRA